MWLGYSVFAYSLSQVRSCNAGFLDMVNPFVKTPPACNPDSGVTDASDKGGAGKTGDTGPKSTQQPPAGGAGKGSGP